MNRIVSSFALLAFAAVSAVGCGDDDIIIGVTAGAGGAGAGGRAGAAGSGGSRAGAGGSAAGSPGTGGSTAGAAGSAGTGRDGSDAGVPDAGDPDAGDADAGLVTPGPEDAGTGNEPEPVCESAVDVITALPYSEPWATTDDTPDLVNLADCQLCDNSGDYIVTFTAPETATYRISATSSGAVELAVYSGQCTNEPDDPACGVDVGGGGDDEGEVELDLDEGESVTIVVSESCEEEGGSSTLTVDIAP